MGRNSRKRKHISNHSSRKDADDLHEPENNDNWKRSKNDNHSAKSKNNYPVLLHPELHKLRSHVTIIDLQHLILHCLADGKTPRWVTVKHAQEVRKAVIVYVPGLERGLFDGSIDLNETNIKKRCSEQPVGSWDENRDNFEATSTADVASLVANDEMALKTAPNSPDNFMPALMVDDKLPEPLKPLATMFKYLWPTSASADERYSKIHSPMHTLLIVPMTKSEENKRQHYETLSKTKSANAAKAQMSKRTPITEFIASIEQLKENDFAIHSAFLNTAEMEEHEALRRQKVTEISDGGTEAGWLDTAVTNLQEGEVPEEEIETGSITAGRNILTIDCEMCKVVGGELALTRVSVVNWEGTVVMDELVKPYKSIIDYLTPFSGMTPAKLDPVTNTLKDIQTRLLPLITPQTIIIGHSLNADLQALQIAHPFIVDTSMLFPHPRGYPLKSSLKWLAQKYLNREIQKGDGSSGHDSIEDARTCLDLVKLKCERGPSYGVSEASGESIYKRLSRTPRSGNLDSSTNEGKTGAMIDHGTPEKTFGLVANFCISCANDTEIVQGIKRAVLGDPDGSLVPGGGVDFTWARLRELENARGWSTPTPTPTTNNPPSEPPSTPPTPSLPTALAQTVHHIQTIHALLPPCTLLIIYSGGGDPRELRRLQAQQRAFRHEFRAKKWDELSVKWTDTEEVAMRRACGVARMGVAFVGVT